MIFFRWFEHRNVYFPSRAFVVEPSSHGLKYQDVYLQSEGHKVHGWFFQAQDNKLAVLVCHGNGGNISYRLELTELLLSLGANVLLFDYRGYGKSEGTPGEEGTYKDGEAAFDWLKQSGYEKIVLYGESLGGGIAGELGLRRQPDALVLQSTFSSIPDIGAEIFPWLPVRMISTIRYETVKKLPSIKVPVLILHSRADSLIRFHHAERLFAAANHPKELVEIHGDHNNALDRVEPVRDSLKKLFSRITSGEKQ